MYANYQLHYIVTNLLKALCVMDWLYEEQKDLISLHAHSLLDIINIVYAQRSN